MKIIGFIAAISLTTGPLQQGGDDPGREITMGLCNGGEITIQIDDKEQENPVGCPKTACHAVTCRDKNKRFTISN